MGFAGRVSALLLLLVAGAVASDQIFTASGVPFGRSSREPRYHVEYHPVDSPFEPHEGWWSYEFCYHGRIRQVHVEAEKIVQEYVLGEYDNDATISYHENSTSEFPDDNHHVKDISKSLFHQEKRTLSIHCNELPSEAEPSITVEDDSLPKEAQISIIPDQDEEHDFTAYAT
nr:unnamed protein product [Digitaria exilis]